MNVFAHPDLIELVSLRVAQTGEHNVTAADLLELVNRFHAGFPEFRSVDIAAAVRELMQRFGVEG